MYYFSEPKLGFLSNFFYDDWQGKHHLRERKCPIPLNLIPTQQLKPFHMVPSISDFKEVINGPLLLSKRVDGGVSEKVLGRQRGAKIIRERVLGPWVSGAVTLDLLVLLALLSLGMVGVIVWSLPHLGLSLIALSSAFPLCRLPCFCRSLPFAHCSFLLLPGMWGSLCRAQGSACWLPLLHLFS